MNSTFFGLELSRRALEAQQTALDITGHNIANANTQGYTRQIASLRATTPDSIPNLGHNISLGTGVTLDYIGRARDSFVDRQYRWESSKQGYWGTQQDMLQKVEGMFNEPSDNSLSSDLNNFWNAWSDLSKDPENMGARSVVRERALALTDSFHHTAQQISDKQGDIEANVKVQVHQINNYADQIKSLNDQIKRAEVAGDNPNDLRDSRDQLVDELSQIVSVRVVETKDPKFTDRSVNNYKVIIGDENSPDNTLVDDSTVRHLIDPPPLSGGVSQVQWEDKAGTSVALGNEMGQLGANLELRDNYLVKLGKQFDTLAQGVVDAVNQIHKTGQGLSASTGIDFFTMTQANGTEGAVTASAANITASNIRLNSVISSDLSQIATGKITTPVAVGDGSVAQALSTLATGWSALTDLSSTPIASLSSSSSIGDFYGASIAQLGVDVQQANRMKSGEDVLVTHISNQRESYSGVSLDEEMTNLVKFQKSYAAAARMVTMMDDMLNTIVNGMGITR